VFTESASGWGAATQVAELTASDGSNGDNLGTSVAITGSTIVAGAPDHGSNGQGAAYVFSEPAAGWQDETQAAELTAANGARFDALGASVAISGTTVFAGAPFNYAGGTGAVYTYAEPAGGWQDGTQTGELTATGSGGLGSSLGVVGTAVVAGAGGTTANRYSGSGAVFVFGPPSSGGGGSGGGGSGGGSGGSAGGGAPRALSGLRISPSRFSVAGRRVKGKCGKSTRRNAAKPRCKRPIQLKISYRLSAADKVTFTLKVVTSGRRVAGRCVRASKRNMKARRCVRLVGVRGATSKSGKAGANTFTFDGKSGGRSLPPGTYQLTASPAGGKPKQVSFAILA
jgi:hypothetical protein